MYSQLASETEVNIVKEKSDSTLLPGKMINVVTKMLTTALDRPLRARHLRQFMSGISKPMVRPTLGPMVCKRVAFHKNDGNHENYEENSHSYKKEFSAGLVEITETTEMTKTQGIWGANHGLEIPDHEHAWEGVGNPTNTCVPAPRTPDRPTLEKPL